MQRFLAITTAVLALAGGIVATVMLLSLLLASAPNSSPQQLRTIRRLMWLSGVGGLLCAVAGTWLLLAGRPWWGAAVGAVPVAATLTLLVYVGLR